MSNNLVTWVIARLCEPLSTLLGSSGGGVLMGYLLSMFSKRGCFSKVEPLAESGGGDCPLLDLPELVLENIFSRLPPEGLCVASVVCKELWKRCTSNHLWELLFMAKWGKVLGPCAYQQLHLNIAFSMMPQPPSHSSSSSSYYSSSSLSLTVNNNSNKPPSSNPRLPWTRTLSLIWPFSLLTASWTNNKKKSSLVATNGSIDSIMDWYRILETGNACFCAQVYNRENGHVGFLLSCYDAQLNYDRNTDTFRARYPPHGNRNAVIEENIQWGRLRAPPIETPAYSLHVSECLNDLKPGDHVEVQWRRSTDFPYGWWYGVVGHADECDGENHHCRCHLDEIVWLEFKQYTVESRWRVAAIQRKTHREEGNEADGFYGGIRKLVTPEEISMWRHLWPTESLE